MKISGNAIRIKFKHIGAGLEARDGQLKGFAIAGADWKFHWAEAHIEGESVVVSSAEVSAQLRCARRGPKVRSATCTTKAACQRPSFRTR
jgi:sialate O-acetylesterase